MKSFRPMLAGLLLGVAALVAIAASVKISDLPLSSTPSTNTFLEIADMDAVTKSSKYLLTNLQTHLTSAAVQGILGQVYQATNANLTALAGNPNLYQATNGTLTEYSTIPTNSFVNKAGDTMSGALTGPTANMSEILVGALAVSRGTLTHAGGNVIVDFAQTNRYWSCTLTGNVTFVLTNAAVGKWANLLIFQTQATNCTPTFNLPAGTTNWFGGAPSTLTAGTIGALSYYCISSGTNATLAAYAETQ